MEPWEVCRQNNAMTSVSSAPMTYRQRQEMKPVNCDHEMLYYLILHLQKIYSDTQLGVTGI